MKARSAHCVILAYRVRSYRDQQATGPPPDLARPRIEESLYRLSVDYLDSLLIHWPNPNQDLMLEARQALIDARDRGLVRHIGVSTSYLSTWSA